MFFETEERRRRHKFAVETGFAWLMAVLAAGPALADQNAGASGPAPVFEVASVKPNKWGTLNASFQWTPQGVRIVNYTLLRLLEAAYTVRDFQISGGPDWLTTGHFDVNAKASDESTPSRDEIRLMLQALLRERFGLITRRETRTVPIYNLVLARQDGILGKYLIRAEVNCLAPETPNTTLRNPALCGLNYTYDSQEVHGRPLSSLVTSLTVSVRRRVVDRTGLTGTFNFFLQYNRGQKLDSPHPSLFTALEEQLGLRLESAKGPVEFIVIEKASQPTPD